MEDLTVADIDWSTIKIAHHTNQQLGSWHVTSEERYVATSLNGDIIFEHSMAGRWPPVLIEGKEPFEGCMLACAKKNGVVYLGSFEWVKVGQIRKHMTPGEFGEDYALDIPGGFEPRPGQVMGFMMSTLCRYGKTSSNERTPLVLLRWGTDQIIGVEGQSIPTTPTNPTDSRLTDLERLVQALAGQVLELKETAIQYDSQISLETHNGQFICSEGGGGGEVNATRTNPGIWETFRVRKP